MPDSIKCQSCGLVNWASSVSCKKCNATLNFEQPKPKEKSINELIEEDQKFANKWGLQEFALKSSEPIPLSKFPSHLGITGCIKLFVMIATIILTAIYGGRVVSHFLSSWSSIRLKYVIGLVILFVPIIFLSLLSAWVTDKIFKFFKLNS